MDTIARLTSAVGDRYRIEREIATGGMATVYLAVDLRHDRHVALKVLKPELHAVIGAERFLSEIKLTAKLQHPNLVPLFDSGTADGFLYYVMPFVEGESLRARLRRERQLPVAEAVEIAVCIAHALEYAHRHGVIHRDLKPENILLVEGQPMVADFGIALAVSNAAGDRLTESGLSLGTPQYMSPEQAAGDRSLDARTDVYSLGAVLYEMLTGDPPHTASTTQAVIAKVLTEPPRSVQLGRPTVPDALADAVERSLEKIPADRFASVHEMAEALPRSVRTDTGGSASGASRGGRARPRGWTARMRDPLVLSAGVAVVVIGLAAFWNRSQTTDVSPPVFRSVLRFPEGDAIPSAPNGSPFALSQDGRHLAYLTSGPGGPRRLHVRSLSQLQSKELAGTDNALYPAFSPNGLWIAFVAYGKLNKIPTAGGVAVPLANVPDASGVSWGVEDVIVVGRSSRGGLMTVPATGGSARELVPIDSAKGETGHRWPVALGDGSVFYTSWKGDLASARIAVTSIDGDDLISLDVSGSSPLTVVDGWLVYAGAEGALRAIPYDRGARRVTGDPVTFLPDVLVGSGGAIKGALSPTAIVYVNAGSERMLLLVDSLGRSAPLLPHAARYSAPRFSPDGRKVAYDIATDSGADIWTYDLISQRPLNITTDGSSRRPAWTPDGSRLVFHHLQPGSAALWWQRADGSGPAELLLGSEYGNPYEGMIVESSNGRVLVYRTERSVGSGDIMYRHLAGDTASRPVAATASVEISPSVSPDGRLIAYASDRSGAFEIYVQDLPGPGPARPISKGGGAEPVWAPDGKRLYYRVGQDIVEATIRTVPSFAVGAQRTRLSQFAELVLEPSHANYDVSRSNQFVMVSRPKESDVVVVLNWVEELRERLKSAK